MLARGPLHILVTDDHEETLAMMAHLLRLEGHVVHTALTVSRAEALAARYEYDLLISDLGLPDGTGEQLMHDLKSRYGLRGLAVSGHTDPSDQDRAIRAGFDLYMAKPIDFSQLLVAIREVLLTTEAVACSSPRLDHAPGTGIFGQ